MGTKENSLELPPLEKLTLTSSETGDEAAPRRSPDLERREQEGKNVSGVSRSDGQTNVKDQATGSSKDKTGPSGSNAAAQKKDESVSPRGANQNWCRISPECMRELFPQRSTVQQSPVRSQIPAPYAVRPQIQGFRSYSYGRNGRGRRNYYDHGDSYYDDLNLSVHDIHDFDDDTDTVCD